LQKNGRGRLTIQKVRDIFEIISPNLDPEGGVGRTQKQKALKQFINVSSRLKPFVFQIHFKHLAVAYIFKYRNIGPGLCFSRKNHGSIFPASTGPFYTRCLVIIAVLHKLLTGAILQTARERNLFPDIKAICGTNVRETQVAHLTVFFMLQTSRPFPKRGYSSKRQ
jgi:hypothetical protein